MFTKLANYLQRVEVINFKITIDARHALLAAAHHPGTGQHRCTDCILLVIWSRLGDIIGSFKDKQGGTPHHKRLDK